MTDPDNIGLPERRPYIGRVNPMIDPDNADQQLLASFLQDRDVPCPLCNYNLRSLKRTHCPECGKAIELSVRVSELSHTAWLVTSFVLSLSAGIGVFFLFIVIKEGMPRGPDADAQWCIIGYILMIPLAIWSVASRRKYLRMSRGLQQLLAVTASLFSIALFCLMFATLID